MASLTNLDPATLKRRSFIYRKLAAAGAEFAEVNGGAVAMRYPARDESEALSARRMALADLSVLPHGGFKGRGTVEWLTQQGLAIGADSTSSASGGSRTHRSRSPSGRRSSSTTCACSSWTTTPPTAASWRSGCAAGRWRPWP